MSRTAACVTALALAVTATFATGCGKDAGASCAKVVDHVGALMGMEIPADQKPAMIAKCEQEPAAKRSCALAAKTPDARMACK